MMALVRMMPNHDCPLFQGLQFFVDGVFHHICRWLTHPHIFREHLTLFSSPLLIRSFYFPFAVSDNLPGIYSLSKPLFFQKLWNEFWGLFRVTSSNLTPAWPSFNPLEIIRCSLWSKLWISHGPMNTVEWSDIVLDNWKYETDFEYGLWKNYEYQNTLFKTMAVIYHSKKNYFMRK